MKSRTQARTLKSPEEFRNCEPWLRMGLWSAPRVVCSWRISRTFWRAMRWTWTPTSLSPSPGSTTHSSRRYRQPWPSSSRWSKGLQGQGRPTSPWRFWKCGRGWGWSQCWSPPIITSQWTTLQRRPLSWGVAVPKIARIDHVYLFITELFDRHMTWLCLA